MAIVFTKQRRSQRILIIVSLLIIVISAIVLGQMFLKKEVPYVPPELSLPPAREIKINFDVLEKIKQFQPFVEIQPLKEVTPTEEEGVEEVKIGRENPFLPY